MFKLTFYGTVVDRAFAILFLTLIWSLVSLFGALYVSVNNQVRYDEAQLAAGTQLQAQTDLAFNTGKMCGYEIAQEQIIPVFNKIIYKILTEYGNEAKQHHKKTHKS